MLQPKSKQAVNPGRLGLHAHNLCARSFEKLAVLHAGGTRRLARATSKAAIDMLFKRGRLKRETLLLNRAHQIDAPTRTVILITRRDVRRTGFETKPAVNTGQDFFLFSSESFSEY
jgi:hypothetical protein